MVQKYLHSLYAIYVSLLRVDPSRVARARIRLPVFSTPCLYKISYFHYSSHSCTISLPSSHVEMNSFMRRTFPYALFVHASYLNSLFMRYCIALTHRSRFAYIHCSCVALIHSSYFALTFLVHASYSHSSFMRCCVALIC